MHKQCKVKKNDQRGHIVFQEQETTVYFRSKAVILSNGGQQDMYPLIFKDFPFLADQKDKIVLAGNFLKKDGFISTMQRITENKLRNIVIVGGSHSGFSSAWIMLHGPATYNRNNSMNSHNLTQVPDAPLKSIPNCMDCCTCNDNKKKGNSKCSCLCKCFGYFQYKDWEFDYDFDLPKHFEKANIKILYRDKIRVFYGTVTQAKQAGYTEFSESVFRNPNGFVYSYSGLRGDAK